MRLRWIIAAALVVAVAGAGVFFVRLRAEQERARKATREAVLRDTLANLRAAISKFHAENGRYPHTLDELVPKYARRIPPDPMAPSSPWRLTTEETVQPSDDFTGEKQAIPPVVIDVHSSAPGYGDY